MKYEKLQAWADAFRDIALVVLLLLGRVVQSVERPSGDVTAYTYTPAGRLESEGRTGQVAYSRKYAYNPDGSRQSVYRDDALNGSIMIFTSMTRSVVACVRWRIG
ncbi:MAG: hypothetical protein KatS3mg019_0056 [Fimbriimonadales bacterium]|nr:MAG: hypothetical protein KatS3mg019_0056 [Fimbriimonadales bacterium]